WLTHLSYRGISSEDRRSDLPVEKPFEGHLGVDLTAPADEEEHSLALAENRTYCIGQ
ncbi:hypothetical protein K0M31_018310, partial [Melipona bicolor]